MWAAVSSRYRSKMITRPRDRWRRLVQPRASPFVNAPTMAQASSASLPPGLGPELVQRPLDETTGAGIRRSRLPHLASALWTLLFPSGIHAITQSKPRRSSVLCRDAACELLPAPSRPESVTTAPQRGRLASALIR